MDAFFDLFVPLLITGGLLATGLIVGKGRERKHYASIEERETRFASFPITDLKTPIGFGPAAGSMLVMGEVVIASDYLKTFLSSYRMIFGGEMKSYTTMLDRARREARLRMIEEAHRHGASGIINVRFETSPVGSSVAKRAQPMSEVLCYGTAVLPARM